MDRSKWRRRAEKFFENKNNMYMLILVMTAVMVVSRIMSPAVPTKDVPVIEYTEFVSLLESGQVDRIVYAKTEEFKIGRAHV